MCTAPGRPVVSSENARRSVRGTSGAASSTAFHFVSGRKSAAWSSSVSANRPRAETEMSEVKHKHRDRRLVRLDHPGEDVGRAAAARPLAHAHAARHARVAVRHVGGRALVAGEDVANPVIEPVQRIVERQARVAAEAEDVLHAVQLQHPDERLRARDLRHQARPPGGVCGGGSSGASDTQASSSV